MDQAGEVHARHMAGVRVEARDIPDRFLRQREMIGEKAAAVLLGEEAVEAPQALRQRADVEQIDDQQIAGLGALDADRARQEVHDRQIDVAHVVGRLVVLDEAAGPVVGLDDEIVAGLDPGHHRDVGMPAVVDHVVLVGRLRQIDLDQRLRPRAGSCTHLIRSLMVSLVGWTGARPPGSGRSPLRRHSRACRYARCGRSPSRGCGRRHRARSSTPARRRRCTDCGCSRISLQQPRDILDDRRLDAFGRLVEQQDLRIARERARDRELLLLAAGKISAAAALRIPSGSETDS